MIAGSLLTPRIRNRKTLWCQGDHADEIFIRVAVLVDKQEESIFLEILHELRWKTEYFYTCYPTAQYGFFVYACGETS
jgi:hypothetical protein